MDEDALDQVYAGDFDGFVERRNELAKRLRSDGDREGADTVKALKKPNPPAWALNQLPDKQRERLLEAATGLREAQERLVAGDADPDDLRKATDAERDAVSEALGAATALAEQAGNPLSGQAADRARQTLHAVALDDEVRVEFERGRLTADHDPPGLGELSLGAVRPSKTGRKRQAKKAGERDEAKRKREELKAAEAEAKKLGSRRDDAEREVDEARKQVDQAKNALKRATERLEKAAAEADQAGERLAGLQEG